MPTKEEFEQKIPIGTRVIYTGRNGNQRLGAVQEYVGTGTGLMANLKLDDSKREYFYVPVDAIVAVPDDLADTLGG